MSLKICSKAFFSNYIINPFSKELTKQEKAGAFCASFFLGIATLGIWHLVAFISLKNKKVSLEKKNEQNQPKPDRIFKEKVQDQVKEKTQLEEEKKTVARENKKPVQQPSEPELDYEKIKKRLEITDGNYPKYDEQPYSYHMVQALKGNKTSQAYIGVYALADTNESINDEFKKKLYEIVLDFSLKAAAQGEPIAYNTLGTLYLTGNYVEQNKEKAAEYFSKAADGGNAEGAYNLAALATDPMERFCLLGKAYQGGYIKAAEPLAEYLIEIGQLEAAKLYLQTAVVQGFPKAMGLMGILLADSDLPKALELLQKAKEQGDLTYAPVIYKLQKANPFLSKSIEFLKAKADSNKSEDLYQYAMALQKAGKANWVGVMEKAAKKDHLKACQEMVKESTHHDEVQNFIEYSMEAAELGDAEAAYRMAKWNEKSALKIHSNTVLKMAKQAQKLEHPKGDAVYKQALLNTKGDLLVKPKDELTLEDHLYIGHMQAEGTGCEENLMEALEHYDICAKSGNKEAQYSYGILARKLNKEFLPHIEAAADSENGNPHMPAVTWLAHYYKDTNYKKATQYFEKALVKGKPFDAYEYGCWLLQKGYLNSARTVLWHAIEQGNAEAVSMLLLSPELAIQSLDVKSIEPKPGFEMFYPTKENKEKWQKQNSADLLKTQMIKDKLKTKSNK